MTDSAINEPLWLFLHLPKTGGTTFKTHLERHLEWDEELIEFSYWGREARRRAGRPEFAERPESERAKARVLVGHRVYWNDHCLAGDREARYITFLRDPAERCVSLYNFRRSRNLIRVEFEEWYETTFLTKDRCSLIDFFASRLAPEAFLEGTDIERRLSLARWLLSRCWHVGLTERLDESLDLLCKAIGIPADWTRQRVAGSGEALESPTHPDRGERINRYLTLDDTLRDRIHADCREDLALYRWVAEGMPALD